MLTDAGGHWKVVLAWPAFAVRLLTLVARQCLLTMAIAFLVLLGPHRQNACLRFTVTGMEKLGIFEEAGLLDHARLNPSRSFLAQTSLGLKETA